MKQNCITDSLSFSGTGWLGKGRSATKNLRRMSLRPYARITCVVAAFSIAASAMCDVIHITEGSSSGYTLTDGNTYVVDNSVSFSNETVGGSGITIADNATVVVFVPADVTLTATLPEDGTAALEQALRDATSANADMEIMDTQFMGRRIK